jgi:AraC-like DNA-binding protein
MAAPGPPDAPPWGAQVDRVRQIIGDTIAPFDVRVDEGATCPAELPFIDLGVVRVTYAPAGAMTGVITRTPRLIRVSDPDFCKIDFQVRGRSVLEQHDRQAALTPGQFGFLDLSRPCLLAGDFNGVAAVMFPRSLLPLRHRDTRELAGVAFGGDTAGSLVAALVGHVVGHLEPGGGAGDPRIGTALVDLVGAALAARADRPGALPPQNRERVLLWQVKAYIERHLGDADLSPGRIAAAHHVSLRYLHRLFERQQTTVGAWIRERRLDHCHRELSDPALRHRPTSAIGARWGFPDATHFGRAFRGRYGSTPGEYRRANAAG